MTNNDMTNGTKDRGTEQTAKSLAQVNALIKQNDLPGATQTALLALVSGNVHPLFLQLRAHALEQQGHLEDALKDLREAVMMEPNNAVSHFAYGQAVTRAGNLAQAAGAFQAAIQLQPGYVAAHFELGQIYDALGDANKRREAYEAVIALKPDHEGALGQLAQEAAQNGDWEGARDFATRLLKISPKHHIARLTLAQYALNEGDLTEADAILRGLQKLKKLPKLDQIVIQTTLGNLRDAQKRYADAFEAYSAANEMKHALFSPRFITPDAPSARDYVGWLGEYSEIAAPALWRAGDDAKSAPAESEAKEHIFLVGFPCSGTTLLEEVLTRHPDAVALQENNLLDDAARDFLSNDEGRQRLLQADEAKMVPYRAVYWKNVAASGVDVSGKIFIDNRSLNVIQLLLIPKVFPTAKIVFVMRDPRDVMLSCFRSPFKMSPAMFELLTLEGAASYYDAVQGLVQTYRDNLALNWIDARHEALIEDAEGQTRALCEALGIEWNACLAEFSTEGDTRDDTMNIVTSMHHEFYGEEAGHWRHYRSKLKPVLPVLMPWVERFGYPAE